MFGDIGKLKEKATRGWLKAGIISISALGVATGAQAGEGHWKKHKGDHGHHDYYAPRYVAVPPGHVHYYAPRPVVMYPAPMAYVPAYPVYAAPSYPGLNFNLNVPLY
jgi:hypothetical protein